MPGNLAGIVWRIAAAVAEDRPFGILIEAIQVDKFSIASFSMLLLGGFITMVSDGAASDDHAKLTWCPLVRLGRLRCVAGQVDLSLEHADSDESVPHPFSPQSLRSSLTSHDPRCADCALEVARRSNAHPRAALPRTTPLRSSTPASCFDRCSSKVVKSVCIRLSPGMASGRAGADGTRSWLELSILPCNIKPLFFSAIRPR
ncbi:hypothetical protein IE81DRAFT_326893 [Ceraceosorus guamensis]|uniref:Uncharacterized protein n=1 Tax=Ceraceosorus guamensis TaxID=1522189 RepID=A0A316VP23_9BASI|nr:hypothetical protein IE81DRAFT_326893 [Ceraceosorus guamensis]PWN39070.1 hypothetical protein IE81DRAFT_326893 [Ceraceosorus guamensis]